MLLKNAVKQMSKHGAVTRDDAHGVVRCQIGTYTVECHSNPPYGQPDTNLVTFRTIRDGDVDELQSDYFAGSHWDNLTQALRYASKS